MAGACDRCSTSQDGTLPVIVVSGDRSYAPGTSVFRALTGRKPDVPSCDTRFVELHHRADLTNSTKRCGHRRLQAGKTNLKHIDWSQALQSFRYVVRNAAPGAALLQRVWRVLAVLSHGPEGARSVVRTRCERGADIAQQLGRWENQTGGAAQRDETRLERQVSTRVLHHETRTRFGAQTRDSGDEHVNSDAPEVSRCSTGELAHWRGSCPW